MNTTTQTQAKHTLNTKTGRLRINWTLGILAVLSTGVLAGCEYCGPVLLAAVAISMVYRFAKPLYAAMQIKPF